MFKLIGFIAVVYLHYYVAKKYKLNIILWTAFGFFLPIISTPLLAYFAVRAHKYRKWPTVEQYRASYPQSADGRGIYCCVCGSDRIKSWGISSPQDVRRLHSCEVCNTSLYRTGF